MKTIEIKLYSFNELSEEAKQKAIEKLFNINVYYNWWESVYEDAKNIGIEITGFNIDRGCYCNGNFILSANEVAQNILNEHGEMCETFKTAESFMNDWQPVFCNYMDENHKDYESLESEDTLNELENEFLKNICEDYRIILSNEYNYLTSEEAIKEAIEANEYDFTEDGEIY